MINTNKLDRIRTRLVDQGRKIQALERRLKNARHMKARLEKELEMVIVEDEFRIAATSDNTNSFGLYQLVLVNRVGDVYVTHASRINIDRERTYILESGTFRGCEMTQKVAKTAPEHVLEAVWG